MLLWGSKKYIMDIYSLAVNTINIFIGCNENLNVFSTKDRNIYGIS